MARPLTGLWNAQPRQVADLLGSHLSPVLQIDETGAEAAAATAVIVGTSAPGGPVKYAPAPLLACSCCCRYRRRRPLRSTRPRKFKMGPRCVLRVLFNCRQPLEFKFDRPFIFDIVHEASGLELFTGEVYVPEKADASA